MCYSCGCSCSCGDDPCGCQQVVCLECTTTSTTTAIPCVGEKCDELYNCDCIIYNGPDLPCYGIYSGDNLCRILEIAASNLSTCRITPPPTTTTTTCSCVGYNVVANNGAAVTYAYLPCGESKEKTESLGADPTKIICTQRGFIPRIIAGSAQFVPLDPECCIPTIVVPIVPTSRCTAEEYWSAVNNWSIDIPVSIQLNNMVLNGIQYATGQILNVNSVSALSIGTGIDGNTYVMNMSDWFNTIATGSGFVFHDDMKVIDKPIGTSTYDIMVTITTPARTITDVYYNDIKNMGWDTNQIGITYWAGFITCAPLN